MLDGELTLELVPGLLVRPVLGDDPVVLLEPDVLPEPDIALLSFTAPLESLQWVAADIPAEGDAPGVVVDGGGELV